MWIFNWSFFSPWRQVPHCLPPLYISVSVFSLRLRPGQSAANNLFGRDVQLPPRGASGNSGQICGVQWAEAAPRIKKREEVKKFEIFYIGFQFYAFRTDCNERGWEETFVSSLHSRYLKSNMLEMERNVNVTTSVSVIRPAPVSHQTGTDLSSYQPTARAPRRRESWWCIPRPRLLSAPPSGHTYPNFPVRWKLHFTLKIYWEVWCFLFF